MYLCIMLKGYRYRIEPNNVQITLLNKHFGACRFLYNLALETKIYAYLSQKKTLSYYDLAGQLPDLKKECEWLKEIDSQALQQSLINLDKAFTQFFKHGAKFPNFKSKRNKQAFRSPHPSKIVIENNKISIPKFKQGIKIIIDRAFKGEIKSAVFSKTPTEKYYISILVKTGKEVPKTKPIKENTAVGIDLGIKDFIVTSEGIKTNNPKYLKNTITRLKVLQSRMKNKKKGSMNSKKAYKRIALVHEKIAFQRKDFLHKLSTELVNNHDTLCFENLKVSNMIKNHCLAQSISDAGWSMFVEMCKYKATWNGKNILQIGTFEPSTKMCNSCGATNHTLTLADREWTCKCGVFHDRDINAARNIKSFALRNSGAASPGVPVEMLAIAKSMKQEVIMAGNYL